MKITLKLLNVLLLLLAHQIVNAQIVNVGNGSYTTTLPDGADGPVVYESYFKPEVSLLPTNSWWSSVGFRFLEQNRFSEPMFPLPLVVKADAIGLGIGSTAQPNIVNNNQFQVPYSPDLFIKLEGLNANETKVDDFSDWVIKASWNDGTHQLKTTYGHGLPYVYCESNNNQTARISFTSTEIEVVHNDGNAICIAFNNQYYGLFAPNGVNWIQYANDFAAALGDKNYFSVALMPDGSAATFETFKNHAFAFVQNSVFSWDYSEENALVSGTFNVESTVKEGNEDDPILLLFPHQWKNTNAQLNNFSYPSTRGEMKGFIGKEFSVNFDAILMMPYLKNENLDNSEEMYDLVDREYQTLLNQNGFNREDTYWHGKELNKYAQLLPIAEQVGHNDAFNYILSAMQTDLEDWFTASPGESKSLFYYDDMGVMIGYPASFNTNTELNDMHFHYSYFVMAASIIARYDQNWATEWKDMVELLIRNCNSWDRNDELFPFLRYFDAYEGHSWANGWALFGDGNNMESSSESINFAAAMVQWGKEMCNEEILSLGMYLYHSEVEAAEQYWFNLDQDNFPDNYPKDYTAIVWGSGGVYGTFWTARPSEVRGINILPVTAYSLYLGRDADYVNTFYNNLIAEEALDFWRYVHWAYLALGDCDRAWNEYSSFAPTIDDTEFGSTEALTNYWINHHKTLGKVQHNITANIAHHAVYEKDGDKTYTAYNPNCSAPKTVNFSDGFSTTVDPGEYKITTGTITSNQNIEVSDLKVFPNPAQNTVQISGFNQKVNRVEIYGLSGNLLATYSNIDVINISDLSPGTYLLKISYDQKTENRFIVKSD